MPQKRVDVLVDGQPVVKFSAKEAKLLSLVPGKRYNMVYVGKDGEQATFSFVEDENGKCEVIKE
jgi:archaellum component FlaG (FlaF/FlaG flagellin family)